MKILVLSDSHSSLHFMYDAIDAIQPDTVIHLGDYYDDATAVKEDYPNIPFIHVPGNCDSYRAPRGASEIIVTTVGGVKIYLTHGHRHHVKYDSSALVRCAKAENAKVALFGHTHLPEVWQEDGMWIMNPGTCGYGGGSAGLIVIENGTVLSCTILYSKDLEALK